MRISHLLTGVVIFTALALGGLRFGRHQLPKPQATVPTVQKAAVAAPAAAAEAGEDQQPAVSTTDLAATTSIEGGQSDPVDGVRAELDAEADSSTAAISPAPATAPTVEFETTDILAAMQQGVIEAALRGNGRERMSAQLRNNSPTPLRVTLPAGQVFEGGRSRVVLTRAAQVELMPAKSVVLNLSTAALISSNTVGDAPYRCSYQSADRVDAFLKWAATHDEISAPAMQTAVLALTENLPLSAVAKFAPVNGTGGTLNTDAFRVETSDLLAALSALRDSGVKMETVAMTVDSQLRIEAMIEPLSREAAKRYFGISEEREWDFWKHELLEGNPSTRHYALFGIARFYPEVALDMLPKWVRETQTHPVYRQAAVQALADTQRPEALPLLRQLAEEVGPKTDLGRTAAQAANYLDKRLTELATRSQVVAFRSKSRVSGF